MADFDQDIIRTVRIQTQADEESIRKASSTLDNFYKKYQTTSVKVDSKDFFQAIDAVRSLRKELESTKKTSPHMEGIIGHMSSQLEQAGQQFEKAIVRFTNGDIAHGLSEAVDKITSGLAIHAVDLGDFLSDVQKNARNTVDALKEIGAVKEDWRGKNYLNLGDLNTKQLELAIDLMRKLKTSQAELDAFELSPLKGADLYSGITTSSLSSYLEETQENLNELRRLNLETISELNERRSIISNVRRGSRGLYNSWEFDEIKEERAQYDVALNNLREYVSERNDILESLQINSRLFTTDELKEYAGTLTDNIKEATLQIQELQQLGGKTDGTPIGGNLSEVTKVLEEIKTSLEVISNVFKNEDEAMRSMAENGITSFTSLSQAIVEVYNNLTQVQDLVDTISQKDFSVTNITQVGGDKTSNLQAMKQQMAVARDTMEHLRQLYDQAGETLTLLGQGGQVGLVMEYAQQLQELSLTDINKSIKGANTEMKLASVLAEMQDYIDKLIQINELRNKYNLGEWKDTFVPTQAPQVKPMPRQEEIKIVTPSVELPKETTVSTNTESQQMINLKGAVDEVSKAIGRKNAGFIKEQEIVNASVEAEKVKLRELVDVITNEIGIALDNIKAKFAQSFVVPELDKNQLQSSFDEIYNKFIELKDKISTMQIDIGINTADITTAIQQALYAKEITQKYRKANFYDLFEYDLADWASGNMINQLTGEVVTQSEAENAYKTRNVDYFVDSYSGKLVGTIQDVLEHLMTNLAANTGVEQENWAQVIVDAINTQGGNVVDAIKLLLPKNISASDVNKGELTNAFKILVEAIEDFGYDTGKGPKAFFENLQRNDPIVNSVRSDSVNNALRTLGLLSESGDITFTIPDTGVRNLGVAIADKVVATTQNKFNANNTQELMQKLDKAYELGASVPRILSLIESGNVQDPWGGTIDAVFQLQERALGVNTASYKAQNEFLNASDEQIDRIIHTFEVMSQVGLYPDFVGDNILFDDQKGFSLVDLETHNIHTRPMDTPKDMVETFLRSLFNNTSNHVLSPKRKQFESRVMSRFNLPPKQRLVNADTVTAERMGAGQAQVQTEVKPSEVKIIPTMDEGAIAKVIEDNIAKTPATVKVTPVVDSASNSEQAVDGESQSALDAAKSFVDAANAKKQFVEANKQVAEGAKESAQAVKEEAKAAEQAKQTMTATADDTVQPSNWDRVTQLQADHGEDPFALSRSKTDNVGDKSVRTIIESWTAIKDEDGELTGEMELNTVKIINDFKKRTDAVTKENEKIKTAQAYLQKFLTQFNNKTMGKGSLLTGYQDLANLANSSDFKIDDIARAEQMMSNLDAEYNKVVQSMRKGSASMNPFVNAINSMDKMEDVLRNISLQFRTLNQQPEWLNSQIIDLYKQLDDVFAETDIYKFAEGFGNLKVSINAVVEAIRQQRMEQKLALSDFSALIKAIKSRDAYTEKAAKEKDGSEWKTYYLDRATEQQMLVDAIRVGLTLTKEQEAELSALSEKHALILKDINLKNNKLEEQKQKYEEIVSLLTQNHTNQIGLNEGTLKVVDRDAYQQRLDDERDQIDNLIRGANLNPEQTKSVEQLIKLYADLKVEASNIALMSKKWSEQNILTDEAKANIEALRQALLQVTSKTDLDLWKKQWKELTNEMSMAKIDAKEDRNIDKLIEDDRKDQVKEYFDLIKRRNDYELRAANEADGSYMQGFYNKQLEEVKEQIAQNDRRSILNQEEKNRLSAIELEQARQLDELKAKQESKKHEQAIFSAQNAEMTKRFDAGYLSGDTFMNWQQELSKYQNYLTGVTQADETTVQKQKELLTQLYDKLIKMSNASKSFFSSAGTILPEDQWIDVSKVNNLSVALHGLYNSITTEKFAGMETVVTGVNEKLGTLTFTANDGRGSLTQYTIAIDRATGATKLLQNTTKPALTVLQKFGQTLKKDFTGLLHAVIGGSGIHGFVRYIRQGIQSVRELDLALTELKKVTDETEETYDRFLETAAKTGARIGSTITDVTSATAEFAKLGYNIELASSMAESALVYANVGDNVDVETGSQSIISTLKAFGIEASNTMSIVDSFNEVGNNFAITTKGIGDALQVSASAMAAAGNSMHESVGLITAANTVVNLCHVVIVIWLLVDNYISQRVWLTRDLGKTDKIIM